MIESRTPLRPAWSLGGGPAAPCGGVARANRRGCRQLGWRPPRRPGRHPAAAPIDTPSRGDTCGWGWGGRRHAWHTPQQLGSGRATPRWVRDPRVQGPRPRSPGCSHPPRQQHPSPRCRGGLPWRGRAATEAPQFRGCPTRVQPLRSLEGDETRAVSFLTARHWPARVACRGGTRAARREGGLTTGRRRPAVAARPPAAAHLHNDPLAAAAHLRSHPLPAAAR